jgi:tyrosine-protein phosphatase YwqE
MLYSEIIAVCSQIHTKHINTLCGQNIKFLNIKLVEYKAIAVINLVKEILSFGSCAVA